jgi:hypothetical protein
MAVGYKSDGRTGGKPGATERGASAKDDWDED